MENNTPMQPTPDVEGGGGASQGATPVPTKSSQNTILIVALIVIVVAIIIGVFWFIMQNRTSETAGGYPAGQQTAEAKTLEEDLNAINIESNDPDFADVDRDLQSL